MKKGILIISMFFLIAITAVIVNAQYLSSAPNIVISLTKQEPDPVEPSKQVEVTIKIDNYGREVTNMEFELLPQYPFSLLPDESPTKFIGTLGALQQGKQTVILKYRLKTAQDSGDGNHKIRVRYKGDKFDWIKLENFTIKVQTHDAILAVEKFYTIPALTAPGDKTKLRIELKNYATSILKDIKVLLNLDKDGDEKKPFSPLGTTNERVISYIEPQAVIPIEYELLVDSDSAGKAYKIPLNIKYSDYLNKNYSKTNLITIVVGDTPDIGVVLERTELFTSENSGIVVLRVVNKGTVDVKFLNVKITQNENVKVIGANEVYMGKLDSDDFSTAEFKLFVKGKNSLRIPVQITYKDANNKNYIENKDVELTLYTSNEIKSLGIKKNNNLGWIVIVAILIIGAYYYYRQRKKKK